MNRSYRILPVYTGDVSGACAALYELGGMVVIHDPSGCNSTYNTHDETRWYDHDSLIFITGLSEIDAILGNDEKLVADVTEAARELRPSFIALVNSPIPYLSGTDFPALCRMIEAETGIPAFYVPTNGMHDYVTGGGQALREIAERFAERFAERGTLREHSLNLLGVTPLDFGGVGSEDSLRRFAEAQGYSVISCWAMGDGLKNLARSGEATANLVASSLGMEAAKTLCRRFGIPWVAGTPIGGFRKALGEALLASEEDGENRMPCRDCRSPAEGKWAAIGEPVQMGSLAAAVELETGHPVRVLSPLEGTEAALAPWDLQVDGEEEAEEALSRAKVIFADPFYKPVCPAGARLIPLPHQAFSGRNGWKTARNLMELDLPAILKEVGV